MDGLIVQFLLSDPALVGSTLDQISANRRCEDMIVTVDGGKKRK